ncbi:MAG: hypothetical protein K2K04_06820 [Clostridia bacterium]|nr:hypothetical protein [Clostridia bacterium]
MIKFDGSHITDAIKKKKLYTGSVYIFVALLIIAAVIAATLTREVVLNGKSEHEYEYFVSLSGSIVCLLIIIGFIVFLIIPANRELNRCVCKTMANGLLAREDMFKGGGNIGFVADYSGDVLTLSRKNFTGAITIDPTRIVSADGLGGAGAKIEMDLKPLKAVPALYATAGTKLWQFLQAYYLLHGEENGAESVTITDNMSKAPLELTVFLKDAPAKKNEKNYFIEKGLIK